MKYLRPEFPIAIALVVLLHRMDAQVMPRNPLVEHIAHVDVRNFNGRKNAREPHIVFRSKDGTQIIIDAGTGIRPLGRMLECCGILTNEPTKTLGATLNVR